mgnify:FL=1
MTQLFSLGRYILDNALFADAPMTKQALAKWLKTSRPTISRYGGIVYYKFSEFRNDYPELDKSLWAKKGGSRDRNALLTPYQSWVISLIFTSYKCLRNEKAVGQFLDSNPYIFTKSKYHQELRKQSSLNQVAI